MEILLQLLKDIEALLGQISAITSNQTTILLRECKSLEEENEVLALLEGMVTYKEELIVAVEAKEIEFEESYSQNKNQITNPEDVKVFKHYVASILAKKEEIKQEEQSNVAIMTGRATRRVKQVEIPKNPSQVTQAYKKQIIK